MKRLGTYLAVLGAVAAMSINPVYAKGGGGGGHAGGGHASSSGGHSSGGGHGSSSEGGHASSGGHGAAESHSSTGGRTSSWFPWFGSHSASKCDPKQDPKCK